MFGVRNLLRHGEINGGTHADGQERDGLVDASEGGNIDGLATDSSLRANTGRVFTGTSVDDSIDENLHK